MKCLIVIVTLGLILAAVIISIVLLAIAATVVAICVAGKGMEEWKKTKIIYKATNINTEQVYQGLMV